jgi:hypothetical protein
MRLKLVLPEPGAYFSDLVACLLACPIRGEQMPIVYVPWQIPPRIGDYCALSAYVRW